MRLGLIGFGNIATSLLRLMKHHDIALEHLAVLCRPAFAATARMTLAKDHTGVAGSVSLAASASELLAAHCDIVVECAGHSAVSAYVPHILQSGVDVIVVSVGSLADATLAETLRRAATEGKARLVLPSGAVGGIDLLSAIGAVGDISVAYRGTKPPAAWRGTSAEDLLDLGNLTQAETFFTGNAREAAQSYPKNANVAATLALAGAGFEATSVTLCADPSACGNIHEYDVISPLARYTMRIENAPSAGNAKTSQTTVFSVLREIRNRVGPIAI